MKVILIWGLSLPVLMCTIGFIGVLLNLGGVEWFDMGVIPYPRSLLYGGAMALFIPAGWAVVFCCFGLVMFLPFRLSLRLLKGIRIEALIEPFELEIAEEESDKIQTKR